MSFAPSCTINIVGLNKRRPGHHAGSFAVKEFFKVVILA
jgi:hypothetical protein